jgi:PleD family two-component response regulator
MSVLIIHGDSTAALSLATLLGNGGYPDIIIKASSAEGFAALEVGEQTASPIGMVIVDMSLPGSCGLDICARIRLESRYADLPIMMLAAPDQHAELENIFLAGADDFIVTPVDRVALLARTSMMLKLRRETTRRKAAERQNCSRGLVHHLAKRNPVYLHPETGLPNRRSAEGYLDQLISLPPDQVGIIALTMDSSDSYVQTYGDAKAAATCTSIARALCNVQAPLGALLTHYEFFTFIAFVPAAALEDIMKLAGDMRLAVEDLAIIHDESRCADIVTMSAGVCITHKSCYDPVHALATALLNVERVSRSGGNRVASTAGFAP